MKLEQRRASGLALESNQADKLSRLGEARTALRAAEQRLDQLLAAAGPELRERVRLLGFRADSGQFGRCGNCGLGGHETAHCPRPAASRSKPAARGKPPPSKPAARGRPPPSKPAARGKPPAGAKLPKPPAAAEHSPAVGKVLVVAEKPSVAKAVAAVMSGGRKRERHNAEGHAPMCALHEFFTHFGPAKGKCSVVVTSVLSHRTSAH